MDEATESSSGDRREAPLDLYKTKITQSEFELEGLIDILRRENVTRFLEVGSRYGGSLWRIARALPHGSLVVAVDSGEGVGGRGPDAVSSLRDCVDALSDDGYDAHAIIGDSQSTSIVNVVRSFGPFDAVFLDGDHSLRGVTLDWKNYGPMARIVAFHDAHWEHPGKPCKPVDVPALWQELRSQYPHKEFTDPEFNFGIGVLWRSS
jgi:hypothetical protein